MDPHTILWRRLDAPGHDACTLIPGEDGWRLDGAAVFRHEDGVACLRYTLDVDPAWRTRAGAVHGWLGRRAIGLEVVRTPDGVWTLNGQRSPAVEDCFDLDFGFTPATNLSQLRRIALSVGQAEDVPVAWLDVRAGTLDRLAQRYERRAEHLYAYDAPRFDYAALLEVTSEGFVERYPGLWETERP